MASLNAAATLPHCPSSSPKLARLIEQVEKRQLHRHAGFADARAWLIHWLTTPMPELNGNKPAAFLCEEDFDLILVGLLIKLETSRAWFADQDAASHVS